MRPEADQHGGAPSGCYCESCAVEGDEHPHYSRFLTVCGRGRSCMYAGRQIMGTASFMISEG